LRAKALVASGKPNEAIKYFSREFDNFPLSCVNLYYYQLILQKTGRKHESEVVRKHMDKILKLKGFDRSVLPGLLKNPVYDLIFRDYKK
jgi:hypothetical protein